MVKNDFFQRCSWTTWGAQTSGILSDFRPTLAHASSQEFLECLIITGVPNATMAFKHNPPPPPPYTHCRS